MSNFYVVDDQSRRSAVLQSETLFLAKDEYEYRALGVLWLKQILMPLQLLT